MRGDIKGLGAVREQPPTFAHVGMGRHDLVIDQLVPEAVTQRA